MATRKAPLVRAAAKPASAKSKSGPSAPEPKAPGKVKVKLVRDTFTFTKDDYALLGALKKRALQLACPAKKSEILRAGVLILSAMPDPEFVAAIEAVPHLKAKPSKKEKVVA